MKNILLSLCIGLAFAIPAKAGLFDFEERPVTVHYSTTGVTASTTVILVDLSSTTLHPSASVYPHNKTGGITVAGIECDIAKVAASSGSLKIGVVESVTATNGDVRWFWSFDFTKSAALTEVSKSSVYSINKPRTFIVDSRARYLKSNDLSDDSTTFQTDVQLPRALGGDVEPTAGDIILSITNSGSNAMNVTCDIHYSSEAP